MMRISVVIPTYNRLDQLKRVIGSLEQQAYPSELFEVIVVSDGSTDGTNDYLRGLDSPLLLRAIIQENQGAATARNRGIKEATGDLILFIDDDLVPAPNLLSEHIRLHDLEEDIVVLGPMLTPPDFNMSPWVRWEQAMLAKQYDSMISGAWHPTPRQFYTGNASLARCHLLAAGGFDAAFRRAEDVELAYRLAEEGLRFVFNPKAKGLHYASRSFESWLEIPYTYGRNDVVFALQKKQRWLLPAVWREFRDRHLLIRLLTGFCLGRKVVSSIVIAILRRCAMVRWHKLTRVACSALFNLRYYQGIADELGGRDSFMVGVRQGNLVKEASPPRLPEMSG